MKHESALAGLRADHVRLIARYWVRFALRTGGGLMTILVVLLAGLSLASIFFAPVEMLMEKSPELGHESGEAAAAMDRIARSEQVASVVGWVTGARQEQVDYMLQDNPALLSAVFLVLLAMLPWIVCLGAFNQTSGDIANKGLRYLLLRTERPNIFFGRFLGALVFLAASLGLLLLLLAAYVGLKLNVYEAGALTGWTLQAYAAFLVLALPYVALCAWVSSAIDSPFGALALSLLASGFPVAFLKLLGAAMRTPPEWLDRLLPWGWKYDLLSANLGTRFVAVVALLGFTLAFLALGARHFRRRDL